MFRRARFYWRAALVLMVALLLLLAFWLAGRGYSGGLTTPPLDDAWIHFRFARNLSQGLGFSYNPGQPTPGSTAPLWTLLLALAARLDLDLTVASLSLSALGFLGAVWLTFNLARQVGLDPGAALLAALGVAASGRMLWAGLSGMEVTAFSLVSLVAVWTYQRRGSGPLTGFWLGLGGQLRPEAHLLLGLVLIDAFLGRRRRHRRAGNAQPWWSGWSMLAVYAVLTAPYLLFSLSATGRPLPNTFYAKSHGAASYSWRTLRETLQLHLADNVAAFVLLPFGLMPVWRRARLPVLWFLGLIAVVPIIVPFVWHHGRYTMPLLPFQMLLGAAGASWLRRRLPAGRVAGTLLAGLFLFSGLAGLPRWAQMWGRNVQEIATVDMAMGRWLAANTRPTAVVAVDDIGAIGFLADRPLFDLNGLITPEAWPALRRPDRDLALLREMARAGVTHLAIFPAWHPTLARAADFLTPLQDYQTATRTIIGERQAQIYEARWPYDGKAPAIARPVNLGGVVRLRGFDLAPPRRPAPLELVLYWESLAATGVSYHVFIHVLDVAGTIVAQRDRPPAGGLAPTYLWQPGDLVRDPSTIPLPPELPAGQYRLQVGLYEQATMQRLLVVQGNAGSGEASEDGPADAILLAVWDWR